MILGPTGVEIQDTEKSLVPEIEEKDGVFHYRMKEGDLVVASVRIFPFEGIVPSEVSDYIDIEQKDGVPVVESSVFVHENFQKRGLGLRVWQEAELEFLKRVNQKVIRYFADMSEGQWSTRNLPKVVELLKGSGYDIKDLWKGTVDPFHVEILEITKK